MSGQYRQQQILKHERAAMQAIEMECDLVVVGDGHGTVTAVLAMGHGCVY